MKSEYRIFIGVAVFLPGWLLNQMVFAFGRGLAVLGLVVLWRAGLVSLGGATDGDTLIAAMKGMKWESPRGPISIDPETRDIVQNIYIRKVEKVDGEPQTVVFDKVENVKDPVKAAKK